MGHSKSKMQCLALPCQGGKTRKAIDRIKERYQIVSELHDDTKADINIWISANNKMLVKQTEARMDKDLYEKEDAYESDEDSISDAAIHGSVFSWMSGSNQNNIASNDLAWKVVEDEIAMIVVCSNGIRIGYLDQVLKKLTTSKRFNKKINIWIDEADVSIGTWGKYSHVLEMSIISEVILVTGTPERIVKKYQSVRVIPYETTYPPCYRRLIDAKCEVVEYSSNDVWKCLAEVLRKRKYLAKPGMRAFTPGGFDTESHEKISDALISIGFVVIILNGTHKELRFPEGNVIDLSPYLMLSDVITPIEFSEHLSRMYVEYSLKSYPLAITGCLCLERGITFQCSPKDSHDGFLFDYGIIPSIDNKATAYQTMARLFGNIGDFPNYKPCTIYTNSATFKKVQNQEEIAVNLARIVYESGQEEATMETLKDIVNSFDTKYGISKLFMNKEAAKEYIESIKIMGTSTTYQLDRATLMISYRGTKIPIYTYHTPERFKNYDINGGINETTMCRIMPVNHDGNVQWICIYLKSAVEL